MTGQELFEALSFVDEKYIAEAETAVLRRNVPWMKVLSVAACLCILMSGVYAYQLLQPKGAMESAMEEPAAAATEAALEDAVSAETEAATAAAPRQENGAEKAAPEMDVTTAAGELQHIPYAALRVIQVLDDGSFEAIVEELCEEPTLFELEMQMTVVIDPAMVPGTDGEITNDLSEILADVQLEVENGAYDAEQNILYVSHVRILEE